MLENSFERIRFLGTTRQSVEFEALLLLASRVFVDSYTLRGTRPRFFKTPWGSNTVGLFCEILGFSVSPFLRFSVCFGSSYTLAQKKRFVSLYDSLKWLQVLSCRGRFALNQSHLRFFLHRVHTFLFFMLIFVFGRRLQLSLLPRVMFLLFLLVCCNHFRWGWWETCVIQIKYLEISRAVDRVHSSDTELTISNRFHYLLALAWYPYSTMYIDL